MCVWIYEARRDDEVGGIYRPYGFPNELTDFGYVAVTDRDVRPFSRSTGPIDDGSVSDY